MTQAESQTEYLLVSEYFTPDKASAARYMTDLAVGLQERGLNMTVCTSQPHYHGDADKQPRVVDYEGVTVRRPRIPQIVSWGTTPRSLNWFLFSVGIFFVLLLDRPEGNRKVLYNTNPAPLPYAIWLACRIRGWEYTNILYDYYPDAAIETGYLAEHGFIAKLWRFLNKLVFRDAEHIVVAGPAMRDHIIANAPAGFDESTVKIIHHWEDPEEIQPIPQEENWFAEEHGFVDTFTVLYSGNIGKYHDLDTLVEAAAEFDGLDAQVVIIGEGSNRDEVVTLAEELGVRGDTVRFMPYQPRDVLPYSLTSADALVVTVEEGFKGLNVSCKVHTGMATGTPILAIAEPGDDETWLVERDDAGVAVTQGDTEGVLQAVRAWIEDPDLAERQGQNARTAFEQRFTEETCIDDFYDLLVTGDVNSKV